MAEQNWDLARDGSRVGDADQGQDSASGFERSAKWLVKLRTQKPIDSNRLGLGAAG